MILDTSRRGGRLWGAILMKMTLLKSKYFFVSCAYEEEELRGKKDRERGADLTEHIDHPMQVDNGINFNHCTLLN